MSMPIADKTTYLAPLVCEMRKVWPENRTIMIVCHGHSVPAGYFWTPHVDTFNSYPHLFHLRIKERFPFAVTNVIVTAIGGANSISGSGRFKQDVLCHKPDLITIDYGLNDRWTDISEVRKAWTDMVRAGTDSGARIILLTPTWDMSVVTPGDENGRLLRERAALIRDIAGNECVGLADSYRAFERVVSSGVPLESLLSSGNHPNRKGHELVVDELMSWFPF